MNLDTVLDIFSRSIEIITKRIEKRREVPVNRNPLADTREDIGGYIIGEPNIEDVLLELQKINTSPNNEDLMAYRGNIYNELFDRLNSNNRGGIEATVIDVLIPFKEYSYSMFPDTLCKRILDVFAESTNESCIKYLRNPSPEMMTNAKAIVLEHERSKAYARGRFFEGYIGDILSRDIVIKTASYLHYYIVTFAIMLDCVLLQSGYDLLELQTLHNIKLIDEHKELLLSEYVGSDGYVKKLLSEVCKSNQPLRLPKEIDTIRTRKYFTRAIELGYIIIAETGLKWYNNNRGGMAQLGYFIQKVFCPKNIEQVPEQAINKLFGVNRIGSAITQLNNAKKPQPWRAEIDNNIFYD